MKTQFIWTECWFLGFHLEANYQSSELLGSNRSNFSILLPRSALKVCDGGWVLKPILVIRLGPSWSKNYPYSSASHPFLTQDAKQQRWFDHPVARALMSNLDPGTTRSSVHWILWAAHALHSDKLYFNNLADNYWVHSNFFACCILGRLCCEASQGDLFPVRAAWPMRMCVYSVV